VRKVFSIGMMLVLGLLCAFCSTKKRDPNCISGDCEDGKGTMVQPYIEHSIDKDGVTYEKVINNGAKYEGEWKNGKMHGTGTMTYPDSKYTGEFKDGEFDGFGTWEYVPESDWGRYTGEWKKGNRHGKGTYSSYALSYDGEWKDDMKHGHGTYRWYDLEYSGEYTGEWKDDMRNGKGTSIIYKDRKCIEKYVGDWKDDEKNGQGIEYDSTGAIKNKGKFKNNKYVGK